MKVCNLFVQLPVVIIGQKVDYTSCIYHNDYLAAKQLTEIMICNGRKQIAYIGVTVKDKAAVVCACNEGL